MHAPSTAGAQHRLHGDRELTLELEAARFAAIATSALLARHWASGDLERWTGLEGRTPGECLLLVQLALGQMHAGGPAAVVIVGFRASMEGDGVGVEAIRRTMTMLQGIFARAVEWQRVAANPVKAVRKPRPQ